MSNTARRDSGYALLAVLWITAAVAALTVMISAAAREAIGTSRNRIGLVRASWNASACVARARAILADTLGDRERDPARSQARLWNLADRVISAAAQREPLGCVLSMRAVGSRLNVNAADQPTLAQVLHNVGVPRARADSLAAAIVAHAPFVSMSELDTLPGLGDVPRIDSVLDVEPGPLVLNQAPREVLALLPGITDEAIEHLLDARRRELPPATFQEISASLSPEARATFDAAFPRLVGMVVLEPVAWVMTARSVVGKPAVTLALEVRLGHGGSTTGIVRWRSWIE